jgi:2-dehydropantoate 2-reductase
MRNICIYGIGGVGGFFGGKIAYEIMQGGDETKKVFFIARGSHLAEVRKHGLILNTTDRRGMICKPTLATNKIEEIPAPDLCLLCVKGYDLEGAVKALAGNIHPSTITIPLLNGVDIYERIRRFLSDGIVLPACVYVATHIERPGVVTQTGGDGVILCGNDPNIADFDPEGLMGFFSQMRIKFKWSHDPYPDIWKKYVFIASFGLVSAYSGHTLGEIVEDRQSRELVQGIMREIVSIAEKRGVELPEGIVPSSIEMAKNFPYETKTSYQKDVEARGRLNEGDLFGGTIIQLGQDLGMSTPITRRVYAGIQEKLEQSSPK